MGATATPLGKEGVSAAARAPRREREVFLLWALGFLAFRTLVPFLSFVPPQVSRPASVVLFMLISLLGPRVCARLSLPLGWRLALIPVFGALSLATAGAQLGAYTRASAALLAGYSDLFLILCAALLGQTLAGLFREPNILVPVALVAGLVDYWGVNYGTTAEVLKKAPEVVSKLSVQMPLPGGPGAMDFAIGIGFGDFVFLTLFLVCARRFALREQLTFWLGFAFLLAAMVIVIVLGPNVPALAPMAAAFLVANWGRFRLQRSEALAMGYAALIVAALIGLWVVFKHG